MGQAEILLVLFARKLWADVVRDRTALYFIDNDAARYGLIRGQSAEPQSMTMLTKFWDLDAREPTIPWFARVPSFSNPADEPSRGAEALVLFPNTPNAIYPKERAIPKEWEEQLVDTLYYEKECVVF